MDVLADLGIKDSQTYRQWARQHHPDKGGNTTIFQAVTAAYKRHIDHPSRSVWNYNTSSMPAAAPYPPYCPATAAATATTSAVVCRAIKKDGYQCTRRHTQFSKYCGIHEAHYDAVAAKQREVDRIQRQAKSIVARQMKRARKQQLVQSLRREVRDEMARRSGSVIDK